MINIDYEGFQNPKLIDKYIQSKKREDLYIVFDSLFAKNLAKQEKTKEELLIDMIIFLKISKKYNYRWNETNILMKKLLIREKGVKFTLAEFYIDFLKSEVRIKEFIDCNLCNVKNTSDRISCINTLEYLIRKKKIPKKNKIYIANFSLDLSNELNSLEAHTYIQKSVRIFKDMNKRALLQKALIKQKEISMKIQLEMHPVPFKLPDEVSLFNISERKIKDIFSKVDDEIDFLILLCSNIVFKIDDRYFDCFSVFPHENDADKKERKSLIDLVNRTTFNDNKIVKEVSPMQNARMLVRRIHIMKKITPVVEMLKQGRIEKKKFIDLLLRSEFIFDEDQEHVELLLELFYENNNIQFLYCVIPNIEKVLRNALVVNGIPEYIARNDNPDYYVTRNLSDTLNAIEENSIMDVFFVNNLRNKLNDERFENYRNRLSHKLDNELFSAGIVNDVFMIFVNILFYNLVDRNETIVPSTETEVTEIMKKMEYSKKYSDELGEETK